MSKNISFVKIFKENGKQGVVGLFENDKKEEITFKFSQYINYLTRHEFEIMNSLKEISGTWFRNCSKAITCSFPTRAP